MTGSALGAEMALAMRPPSPRPRRDLGAAAMELFACGGWDKERLAHEDARWIRNLVGIDDVLRLRTGFLGDDGQGIAFLHGVTDAFLGVIVSKRRLHHRARGHALRE